MLHFPTRPLIVVFEPHTFSWRSRDALAWYDTVFEGCARVLVCPPPGHGSATHDQSSFDEILDRVATTGVPSQGVTSAEEAIAVLSNLNGDEIVLLLSSGPLLGLPAELPVIFDDIYASRSTA